MVRKLFSLTKTFKSDLQELPYDNFAILY